MSWSLELQINVYALHLLINKIANGDEGSILDDIENIEIIDYLKQRHARFVSLTIQINNCNKTKQTRRWIMKLYSYNEYAHKYDWLVSCKQSLQILISKGY